MDDGILERLGVCFGEAGLGGLDGGDAALEDVGGTVDAVLLAHGIRAALISILLAVRDALRNTDGDGLDGLNALGGGDGHGAANADGQALRALFLALEGQNIAEASDITEALAKGACLVVEGGGFILALRGEEDAGELAVAAGILTGQGPSPLGSPLGFAPSTVTMPTKSMRLVSTSLKNARAVSLKS